MTQPQDAPKPRSRWQEHEFDCFGPRATPAKGACYVIYLDGVLTYIGQTGNFKARLANYNIRPGYADCTILTPWGPCRSIKIKVNYGRRFGDWATREVRLIRRLQPPANCVGSTKRRSA